MFFFFYDAATTGIYTLSLHDALPISIEGALSHGHDFSGLRGPALHVHGDEAAGILAEILRGIIALADGRDLELKLDERSEEHTSELQSHVNLVCRLLLEKKKRVTKQT